MGISLIPPYALSLPFYPNLYEYAQEPVLMKSVLLNQCARLVLALCVSLIIHTGVSIPYAIGETGKGEKVMSISQGKTISIEYTLKLEDKTVVDSNVGGGPLTYIHGSHQIIPGLEKALEGMKIGDIKEVTVKPEEGYGPLDVNALMEVNKEMIPPDAVEIGNHLQGKDQSGKVFSAKIAEIKENTVVLDFNHPLAGKTLYFDVKVLNILEVPQP